MNALNLGFDIEIFAQITEFKLNPFLFRVDMCISLEKRLDKMHLIMYVRMYVCIYVCMYVRMYVCMYCLC